MNSFNKALQSVLRYGIDHSKVKDILVSKVQSNPDNKLYRQLLGDHLEQRERHLQLPEQIDALRNMEGSGWLHQDKEGVVRTGKNLTPDILKDHIKSSPNSFLDVDKSENKVYNGVGGSWFTLKNDRGNHFLVRWSHLHQKPMWETAKKMVSPQHAESTATRISNTPLDNTSEHNTGIQKEQ